MVTVTVKECAASVSQLGSLRDENTEGGEATVSPLGDLSCIEFSVDDLREHSVRYEWANTLRESVMWSLVEPFLGCAYMVAFKSPREKNRVRSHKGLFSDSKLICKSAFREQEFDYGDKSYFVGTVKIDKSNRSETVTAQHKPFGWFLFVSSESDIGKVMEELAGLVPKCTSSTENPPFIQFEKIAAALVRDHQAAISVCGNDGRGYLGLRVVVPKPQYPEWMGRLNRYNSVEVPDFPIPWIKTHSPTS
jgi:hypothetical protein